MCIKNIWKYIGLVGMINLIIMLFYAIISLIIYGNKYEEVPLWFQQWFNITLGLILTFTFIGVISNIKSIIQEVGEFLKC